MNTLSIIVPGRAYPQGSKRHVGHGRMIEQAGTNLKQYRANIKKHASAYPIPTTKPVSISIAFLFQPPKRHIDTTGNLKTNAPGYPYPCKRGDIDKLARAVNDALTGVWFHDDAQIVHLECVTRWHTTNETQIRMQELDNTHRT
jgi:crossover junction endodeoxyribonuclease RusA